MDKDTVLYEISRRVPNWYRRRKEMEMQLENVDVKGTNLKNSLLICGGLVAFWWLFLKKKKRG